MRTRSDYRTVSVGSFAWYLLEVYPLGRNYTQDLLGEYKQLVETKTDGHGNYVHLEGGRPALKHAFVNELDGTSWEQIRETIDFVRTLQTNPAGDELIQVLEWFMYKKEREARGDTLDKLASRMGRSPRSVYRYLHDAISVVEVMAKRFSLERRRNNS